MTFFPRSFDNANKGIDKELPLPAVLSGRTFPQTAGFQKKTAVLAYQRSDLVAARSFNTILLSAQPLLQSPLRIDYRHVRFRFHSHELFIQGHFPNRITYTSGDSYMSLRMSMLARVTILRDFQHQKNQT